MGSKYRPAFSKKPAETLPDVKPTPRGESAKMQDLALAVSTSSCSILRKQGIRASVVAKANGRRVLVEVSSLPEDKVYSVNVAIAEAIEELKNSVFAGRHDIYHTVIVNGQRMAYSY